MTLKIDDFKDLLKSGKLIIDGKYLTSRDISKSDFSSWFPEDIYDSSQFDDNRNEGSVDIVDVEYIFDTYHDFVKTVNKHDFEGDEVYINGESFLNVSNFKESYLNWLHLFKLASEHDYVSEAPRNSKTFIIVDGSGSTEVIELNISLYSPKQVKWLIENISDPALLLGSCSQKDAHQCEKLSVLKTSLLKWLKDNSEPKLFLLCSSVELLNLFHLNYETYLRSFSFEDFIKDLEDDVSEFVNKVEDQVQSFYIQALAVPGTVILASALRGAEKSVNLALIFSSFLALVLVFRSLNTKTKFIDRVTSNTKLKLNIYKNRTEDITNVYAKDSISEKLNYSIKQIEDLNTESKQEIEKVRDIIIGVVAMYLIAAVIFSQI
tara:strand:+ start:508 stop:1641 length:1134 start_codon:yes stop_codon:yes gene_type:complete